MTNEKLQSKALKKIESSLASEVVARPGRLPKHKAKEAFIHRVRQQTGSEAGLFATGRLRKKEMWAKVARSSLRALQRIYDELSALEPYSVSLAKICPKKEDKGEVDMDQAHEMLRVLLDALRVATYQGFVASVILEKDGKLRSKKKFFDDGQQVQGAEHDHYYIAPMEAYRDQPVVRLDK